MRQFPFSLQVDTTSEEFVNSVNRWSNPWFVRTVLTVSFLILPKSLSIIGLQLPVASITFMLFGIVFPYFLLFFKSGKFFTSIFWLYYILGIYGFFAIILQFNDRQLMTYSGLALALPVFAILITKFIFGTTADQKAVLGAALTPLVPVYFIPDQPISIKISVYIILTLLGLTIVGFLVSAAETIRSDLKNRGFRKILASEPLDIVANILQSLINIIGKTIVSFLSMIWEFIFHNLFPIILLILANFMLLYFDILFFNYHKYNTYSNFWRIAVIISLYFMLMSAFFILINGTCYIFSISDIHARYFYNLFFVYVILIPSTWVVEIFTKPDDLFYNLDDPFFLAGILLIILHILVLAIYWFKDREDLRTVAKRVQKTFVGQYFPAVYLIVIVFAVIYSLI